MRLLALAALALSPAAVADGPAGYNVASGYTLSDSEKCGLPAEGKTQKDGRCGNLGGALKSDGKKVCGGSATGYATCVKDAATACTADPACYSFIVPSIGQPGNNWATYSASVGNAAPNKDWDVYYKSPSGFMPCTACPGGGTPVPNPGNGYAMEWGQHCPKLSSAWEQGATTKIYCGPPLPASWGMPFVVALGVFGALYVGVGVGAGQRGASGGMLAGHLHYALWQEAWSMVLDGVAFAQQGDSNSGGGGSVRIRTHASSKSKSGKKSSRG